MSETPLLNAAVLTLLLFCAMITIGWVGAAQNPAIGEQLIGIFEKEVAGQVMGAGPAELCAKIFFNNLGACIVLFLGGASFGIVTILIMSLNGIVIGAIMEMVLQEHSPAFVAAAIVPHGIFEIPGFITAGALGFLFSQALINEYYGHEDAAASAARYARLFVTIVLPLIAVAAVVEAFITPGIIQMVV
ncbi:MAG TPA: stage II sporulation protein M [Methanoregulaceae archaeon]|nr:stage II sporulation protein M [Methanoregulaceae archaeon]HPD75480.1 stage II sporulation protein M [Methanoregulaceae archaeon]HRY74991.1 stage II sporulation protein M [Methanoregulaceae archaeon]